MVWGDISWRHTTNCCVRQSDGWVGGSLMVWGDISWRHNTSLIVIDGNLTSRRYIVDVIAPAIVPFMRNSPDVILCLQNKA